MKRLLQFFIALVMLIQGMQMAVAATVQATAQTALTPREQKKLDAAVERALFQRVIPRVISRNNLTAKQRAKLETTISLTRPETVSTLKLDKAGGRVKATLSTVPDAYEQAQGLPAGTRMVVTSQSDKLTLKDRKRLAANPLLSQIAFPGRNAQGGREKHQHRVTFQSGESLQIAGKVRPDLRERSTVVVEEAPLLSDGTLGDWSSLYTVKPDARGHFAQAFTVTPGFKSVRTRLVVENKDAPSKVMATANAPTSYPVSPSDMPFNTFGITTSPWQVANNQGFDNNGNYYNSFYTGSATKDPVDGTPIVWQGLSFPIGPVPTSNSQVGGKNGPQNVVHAAGQVISAPQGTYDWLYLAGAGANGNQLSQPITLTYTDGTTETWTQSFTDWSNNGDKAYPTPVPGESVIQEMATRINQLGNLIFTTTYVYGYAHRLTKGKTLESIKLPSNDDLGILSIVGGTGQPIVTAAGSYTLGQINLTGTDVLTLKIDNEQSDALTFAVANWPQGGCNPTTTTEGCTYSTISLTVPDDQTKTVTYIAPSNYNNMGFTVQKADNNCVGKCSTYIPDWTAGVNGTSCSDVSPTPGQNMAAGQTWTIYAQNQSSGYNGFLDGPGMPASQNSNKYPNGCVFAMGTAFQDWVADQPAWAKWLEAVVGVAIGIALAVFAAPELAAWWAGEATADVIGGAVATEVSAEVSADVGEAVVDELATQIAEDEFEEYSEEYFRELGERMKRRMKSTIIDYGSSWGGSIVE
ncbi:MAG: hypothetical protein K9K68_05265 [Methylococcaceae bacterium]|nr:hypothetical protein [Methylococcaceae bacterium]